MRDSPFSQSGAAERRQLGDEPPRRAIWPWVAVAAAITGFLVWRTARQGAEDAGEGRRHAAVGTKLTELALAPLTGEAKPVSVSDLAGKVTLINFWGPWCGPCAVEFPHLVELEQHFRSRSDFQFLSVSSNPDPNDVVGLAESTREFMRQMRADFPTYRDVDAKTQMALIRDANLLGFGYPTTVLVDRQGVIRALWEGYKPGIERQMRQAIEDALKAR